MYNNISLTLFILYTVITYKEQQVLNSPVNFSQFLK